MAGGPRGGRDVRRGGAPGMVKSATFGVLVGLIGCYQGFHTGFGTEAVGSSTTQTVVATSIAIIVSDFVLTTIFLPAV